MDEIHKVVKNGCLVHRKMKSLVVGVDAIKALNDIFSIKTQTLRVGLAESTLCCIAGPKESEDPVDSSLITHIIPHSGVFTGYWFLTSS